MIEKLKELMSKYVDDVSGITEESSLIGDVGMSSLDFMLFVSDINDEFGIKISNREFVKLHTVSDIIKMIKAKQ